MKKDYRHLLIFFFTLLLYILYVGPLARMQSGAPQYIYLARAFLDGHLDLRELPASTYDLILFDGKWYVPGGMGPAVLMMPFVALFGTGWSDVAFGILVGAANILLAFILLGRVGLEPRSSLRVWLTVLFAAGTAHLWVTSVGGVWFNALAVGTLFMLLYVNETLLERRPWLAGLWLGLAGLARPTTLFAFTFFVAFTLLRTHGLRDALLKKLIPFGMTLALMLGVMLGYNVLRFRDPLEFGYSNVQGNSTLMDAYHRYGGFSPVYMPCNLYVSLAGLPNWFGRPAPFVNSLCGHLAALPHAFDPPFEIFDPRGLSLFLATPAFFYLFKARWREPLNLAAVIGMFSVLPVLWMYHTTGWVQFGYRYSLDILPFLLILTASGMLGARLLAARLTIIASIAINFIGLSVMLKAMYGTTWIEMWQRILSAFL